MPGVYEMPNSETKDDTQRLSDKCPAFLEAVSPRSQMSLLVHKYLLVDVLQGCPYATDTNLVTFLEKQKNDALGKCPAFKDVSTQFQCDIFSS